MKNLFILATLIFISQSLFGQFQLCNSSTSQHLKDIWFIDENVGIAVGDSGTIVRSTDGGVNWNVVMSNDTVMFKKVNFFDDLHGIAVGSHIFTSNDSGQSWSNTTFANNQFYDVEILDQNTCIVSGEPIALIKSTNNGFSFSILVEQQDSNLEYGLLSFVDENIGYACTYQGGYSTRTLKTTDGGNTWMDIIDSISQPNPTVMEAMSFVSESTGFKGGWYNSHLQKTTDGSNYWTDVAFADSLAYFQLIDFHIEANLPNTYFACGWYGTIFKSTDGGNYWIEVNSDLSNTTSLNGIFFINDNIGWAVGQNGTIIKTTNGGIATQIDEITPEISLSLYPNPTKGNIYIKSEENCKIENIDLLTLNGQYLKSFNNNENIKLNNLSNGYYFLRVATDNGVYFEKILKE